MDDLSAQRTLVKSPPELWAEISDIESLARHLGDFGDIRITQLEPETTVAWEGDRIRGTVSLEAAGWGTKVTLAAELTAVEAIASGEEPVAEPEREPTPEPAPVAAVAPGPEPPTPKHGFFARLFGRKTPAEAVAEPETEAVAEPETEVVAEAAPTAAAPPEPVAAAALEPVVVPEPDLDADGAQAILVSVLDDLGAAHHRPFSRG